MPSKITIKKSSVITEGIPKAPVAGDLDYGELAINYAAGRLYYKDSANNIQYFLSGVMPISLGGTGQTTQTAAFDALAPTTTKGDLIVDNGTNNVRLPVGNTNGHVLTVDSAEATGLKWAAVSGGSGGTTTNALTIGTGLSGTSFNGSSAVTIAIDSTVATLTGTQTLTNKTISLPTIDNIRLGYSTTITSASTTTLTASSNRQQFFTGTTTQTIQLPVTSTLVTGINYTIENNSTNNLTVNSSGGNLVATVIPGTTILLTCIGTTLTTAADWDISYIGFSSITGTGANVLATAPSISNLVITGTLTAGGGVGTNGQVLTSSGSGVSWTTPSASNTPRTVTISDGTSIAMNSDTTDIAVQANTQAAGTLTISAPTGTPVNGQRLTLRLTSTNVQTFNWSTATPGGFLGGTDISLPTASTGGGKKDYYGFIYDSIATKWHLIARATGY